MCDKFASLPVKANDLEHVKEMGKKISSIRGRFVFLHRGKRITNKIFDERSCSSGKLRVLMNRKVRAVVIVLWIGVKIYHHVLGLFCVAIPGIGITGSYR